VALCFLCFDEIPRILSWNWLNGSRKRFDSSRKNMNGTYELVIKPRSGWQPIDWKESFLHRELLGFLVWRDIKIRYRQTFLGGLWAILQPLIAMTIFTLVFNRLAGVKSDGPPYPLFAFAGLAPWTFFANGVSMSSNSLVANQHLVSKIYFPRVFIPIGAVLALLVDLSFSLGLLLLMMIKYHWSLTVHALLLPIFIVAAFLSASGIGLALSALNVSFRDVKYLVPFLIQMGIFVTPVIYPIRYVPARFQPLVGLNPMTGVVLGFRSALLGSPADWRLITFSLAMSMVLFITGLLIFRRMERRFADII
jgi:lipopolysaccharide transport system permease protein